MIDALEVLHFEDIDVRMLLREGQPWWVGKDVCRALGISEHRRSLSMLDADERDGHTMTSPSGQQEYVVVNEAGLWSLILRSRRPEAKRFKRWLTHDVLPSIRATGSYSLSGTPQHLVKPMDYREAVLAHAAALTELGATLGELHAAQEQIEEMTPHARAWEQICDATGEYTVAMAAQMLNNLDGVSLGQKRLFEYLRRIDWVLAKTSRRAARANQSKALNPGYLRMRPGTTYPWGDGLRVSAPQVLVTGKGLRRLAELLLKPMNNVLAIESGEFLRDLDLIECGVTPTHDVR